MTILTIGGDRIIATARSAPPKTGGNALPRDLDVTRHLNMCQRQLCIKSVVLN